MAVCNGQRSFPDITLFVQATPALVCVSSTTGVLRQDVERQAGVPVKSVTYEGTGGFSNVVVPFPVLPGEREGAPCRPS